MKRRPKKRFIALHDVSFTAAVSRQTVDVQQTRSPPWNAAGVPMKRRPCHRPGVRSTPALLALLLLAGCAGGRPPIDVLIRGGEHHLDWSLGVPF